MIVGSVGRRAGGAVVGTHAADERLLAVPARASGARLLRQRIKKSDSFDCDLLVQRVDEFARALTEEAVEEIVATLALALKGYDLGPDDEVHAARLLRSAFHGFAHLEAGDGHPKPHDLDDTFDHIIDLLCAGVRRL